MNDLKLSANDKDKIDSLTFNINLVSQDIGIVFGIIKCGLVTLKWEKLTNSRGIELANSQIIKEVGEKGYKYLGVFELDKIKEKEVKMFKKEYLMWVRLAM